MPEPQESRSPPKTAVRPPWCAENRPKVWHTKLRRLLSHLSKLARLTSRAARSFNEQRSPAVRGFATNRIRAASLAPSSATARGLARTPSRDLSMRKPAGAALTTAMARVQSHLQFFRPPSRGRSGKFRRIPPAAARLVFRIHGGAHDSWQGCPGSDPVTDVSTNARPPLRADPDRLRGVLHS